MDCWGKLDRVSTRRFSFVGSGRKDPDGWERRQDCRTSVCSRVRLLKIQLGPLSAVR